MNFCRFYKKVWVPYFKSLNLPQDLFAICENVARGFPGSFLSPPQCWEALAPCRQLLPSPCRHAPLTRAAVDMVVATPVPPPAPHPISALTCSPVSLPSPPELLRVRYDCRARRRRSCPPRLDRSRYKVSPCPPPPPRARNWSGVARIGAAVLDSPASTEPC